MRPSPSVRAANQAVDTCAAILRAHLPDFRIYEREICRVPHFYAWSPGERFDFLGTNAGLIAVARCIVEHEAHTPRLNSEPIPTPAPVRGTTQSGAGDEVRP